MMGVEKEAFHNVAIYIRTSTEEQDPMNQLRDCESIRPKGQKVDTFVDYSLFEEKKSAWKEYDRPVFNKIRVLIRQKKIKDLIVWDLDRIYRNRRRLVDFFEYCKLYKCNIHSYRQSWLEDIHNMPQPFNEIVHSLLLQIMGWLAEEESQKKSDRIKIAIRKKGDSTTSYRGNKWGRKPISTFKKNKISEMHELGGFTIREMASELNVSVGVVHKLVSELKGKKHE